MASAAAPVLVVWDFDWSLINENSDTYAVEQLAPALHEEMLELSGGAFRGRWTELCDHVFGRLAAEGVSQRVLTQSLEGIPVFPENLEAVRSARAAGAEQRILSDANTVLISTILDAHGLSGMIAEVATNGGYWDSNGALRVSAHDSEPHQCPRCPQNLCKGRVLERWLQESAERPRVIYIGDGGGDLCPVLRLGALDTVCARVGMTLHNRLTDPRRPEADALRAQLRPWTDGGELLRHFHELLAQ